MELKRFEDWPARLQAYLTECRDATFVWGKLDCALFAAGAVRAMTGKDFSAPFLGRYSTERGANIALARYGQAKGSISLKETVIGFLGLPVSKLKAQRGDVIGFRGDAGFTLGVADLSGTHFVALTPTQGLVRLKISSAVTAWRV